MPSLSATPKLLTRTEFRQAVLARSNSCCVACPKATEREDLDAHHILNRNLWVEPSELGGYFLDNGAALCPPHHLEAEYTLLGPEELRALAGITRVVLPKQLAEDADKYDTWGNTVLANGTRLRGPLFDSEACQKALATGQVLDAFVPYVKYPRTPHLSWSPGATEDDAVLVDLSNFAGQEVVVTEKLDGESATLYRDYYHARSLSTPHHPSQTKIKALHAQIKHDIPEGWRVCVENCAAKHTIAYTDLDSLFPVLSIWDDKNTCLSWDDTIQWATLLGLTTAPVLYRGPWDEKSIQACYTPNRGEHQMEGYVIRVAKAFRFGQFRNSVVKYVAKHFKDALSQSNVHWASAPVVWNKRRAGSPYAA